MTRDEADQIVDQVNDQLDTMSVRKHALTMRGGWSVTVCKVAQPPRTYRSYRAAFDAYCGTPDEDDDVCSECGAALDDGEGYDGKCGSCADRAEEEG